ncbi:MAG: hypothetical protein HC898_10340 [Phycisphaerales bacterium]|nr:hypothetical protein [Phycisphaerales bacterium]
MENRARRLALGLYLPLVMCLLVAGLYSSSLRNPFLEDDRSIITANPDVVEPGGWAKLWHHHERLANLTGLASIDLW